MEMNGKSGRPAIHDTTEEVRQMHREAVKRHWEKKAAEMGISPAEARRAYQRDLYARQRETFRDGKQKYWARKAEQWGFKTWREARNAYARDYNRKHPGYASACVKRCMEKKKAKESKKDVI